MSVTIAFTKEEIFRLVNEETIYLSDPIGTKDNNAASRIADVIPLTQDDKSFVDVKLYEVGARILSKTGFNVTDIQYPYAVTDDTYPPGEFPDCIVFRFNLYTNVAVEANKYVVLPMVQQHIMEAIVAYIVTEWLKIKGYEGQVPIYQEKFIEALREIKSALMYKQRASKTYRTL